MKADKIAKHALHGVSKGYVVWTWWAECLDDDVIRLSLMAESFDNGVLKKHYYIISFAGDSTFTYFADDMNMWYSSLGSKLHSQNLKFVINSSHHSVNSQGFFCQTNAKRDNMFMNAY